MPTRSTRETSTARLRPRVRRALEPWDGRPRLGRGANFGTRPESRACEKDRGGLMALGLQESLGVDRGLAAHARRSDGLTVREVHHVACGEDAVHARLGGRLSDDDVAALGFDLALEE